MGKIAEQGASKFFFNDGALESLANGDVSNPDVCRSIYPEPETPNNPGGLPACFMVQQAIHTAMIMAESNTSQCYLSNMAQDALIDQGVTIVSGDLPNGSANGLFSPGDEDRLVMIQLVGEGPEGGEGEEPNEESDEEDDGDDESEEEGEEEDHASQNIFIDVGASDGEGNLNITLTFCDAETNQPKGVEELTVEEGIFTASSSNIRENEADLIEFAGAVALDKAGKYVFNGDRLASVTSFRSEGQQNSAFKASVSKSGNLVTTRTYDKFGSNERKAIAASRVNVKASGKKDQGLHHLQFLSGAFKDQMTFGCDGEQCEGEADEQEEDRPFSMGIGFKNGLYRVDPGNAELELIEGEEFLGGIYSSLPTDNSFIDLSDAACNRTPDIVIELDFSQPKLQAISEKCESDHRRSDGADNMCRSQLIQAAEDNFFELCNDRHGDDEGGEGPEEGEE